MDGETLSLTSSHCTPLTIVGDSPNLLTYKHFVHRILSINISCSRYISQILYYVTLYSELVKLLRLFTY